MYVAGTDEKRIEEDLEIGPEGLIGDPTPQTDQPPLSFVYKGDPVKEKAWIVAKYEDGYEDRVEIPREYDRHVIDFMGPEGEPDWNLRKWYEYLKFYK